MTRVVEEARVTVRGVELAYREAGAGTPLLLVHGNFASKRWFAEQLSSPPPGWRLLALDLPNFGDSQRMPEAIEIDTYADYLAGFCDSLGLERLALLGHSLGGAVVQALAVRRPQLVTHLLLVSSAAPHGHVTPESHYQVLEALKGDHQAMSTALAATMPSRRPPYFSEIIDDALAMASAGFSGNGRALERFDVSSRTARVLAPMLVLHGELDLPHLITSEIATRTAQAYPNSRLERWRDVGHSPQIESPERFNSILTAFLEEQP